MFTQMFLECQTWGMNMYDILIKIAICFGKYLGDLSY